MYLYSWVYVYSTGMVETLYNDTRMHVSSQSHIQWCCLTPLKLTVAWDHTMEIVKLFKSGLTHIPKNQLFNNYQNNTEWDFTSPPDTILNCYVSQKKWAGIESFKQGMTKTQLSFLKDRWDYRTEKGRQGSD